MHHALLFSLKPIHLTSGSILKTGLSGEQIEIRKLKTISVGENFWANAYSINTWRR